MKIFCNFVVIVYKIIFLQEAWIQQGKIELVARAFAAFEMKLPIIASSEEQQKKLKLDYEN